MRKSDLIERVVQATGLSVRQADEVVSSTFEQITNALARGENFRLVGFGAFSVKPRAARPGRHPQTGEVIMLEASNQVLFRPGESLKASCR